MSIFFTLAFWALIIYAVIKFFTKKTTPVAGGAPQELLNKLISVLEKKGVITKEDLYGSTSVPYSIPEQGAQSIAGMPENVADRISAFQTAQSSSTAVPPVKKGEDFSGSGKWLTLVGVIAVLLGVAFFLQYAFTNNLIGETGRVALGLIAGAAFLFAGEFFYKKHSSYSAFITGGGIGLLYLSVYASSALYHMIGQTPAFFFMIMVTATSVLLAVRYNLIWIAGLGLLGGFLTPVLLSTGERHDVSLWNYVILLDVGMLAVAYFKKWSPLIWGSFIGTMFLVFPTALGGGYAQSGFWSPVFYLLVFWAVFEAAILIFYYFHEEKPEQAEFIFVLANGVVFAAGIYSLLNPHYHATIGFLPFLMAVAYTGVALAGIALRREERSLFLFPAGMAIFFLTLVFPMSFEGMWITISWFLEAALIAWIGFAAGTNLAAFSIPVAIVAYLRLTFVDGSLWNNADSFIFNERTFLILIATIASFFLGKMLSRVAMMINQPELNSFGVFSTIVANGLIIAWAWGEIGGLVVREVFSRQGGSIAFSVFLAGYALMLLMIGIGAKSAPVRQGAVVLFGVVIFKTFLIDVWALGGFFRISAFIFLGVILLTVGYLYSRFAERIKGFLQGR